MASGQSRAGGDSRDPSEDRGKNARAQKRHREKKKAYVHGVSGGGGGGNVKERLVTVVTMMVSHVLTHRPFRLQLEVQLRALQAEIDRLRQNLPGSSSSPRNDSGVQHTPSRSAHSSTEPSITSSSNTSGGWISDGGMTAAQNANLQEENKRLREMVHSLRCQLEQREQLVRPPAASHADASASSRPAASNLGQGYATQPSSPSGMPLMSPPAGMFRRSRSDSDWPGFHLGDYQGSLPLAGGFMVDPRHGAESSSAGRLRMAAATCSSLSTSAASEATLRPAVKTEEEDDPLAMLRSSLSIRQAQPTHQDYSFPPFYQPTRNQPGSSADLPQFTSQDVLHQPGMPFHPFPEFSSNNRMSNLQPSQEFAGLQRGMPNLNLANPTIPTHPTNHRAPPDFNVTQDFLSRWQEQQRGQGGERQ